MFSIESILIKPAVGRGLIEGPRGPELIWHFYLPRMRVGNVFLGSLCVCVSVWTVTFEWVDINISLSVWWYNLTISGSSLCIKVIGPRQGQILETANLVTWTSV